MNAGISQENLQKKLFSTTTKWYIFNNHLISSSESQELCKASSSLLHCALHKHMFVQDRTLDLHEKLWDVQSSFQWHLTTSIITLLIPILKRIQQILKGKRSLTPDSCLHMCHHVMMRYFKASIIGVSFSLYAMYLQNKCQRKSGMLEIWMPFGQYVLHINLVKVSRTFALTPMSSHNTDRALMMTLSASRNSWNEISFPIHSKQCCLFQRPFNADNAFAFAGPGTVHISLACSVPEVIGFEVFFGRTSKFATSRTITLVSREKKVISTFL